MTKFIFLFFFGVLAVLAHPRTTSCISSIVGSLTLCMRLPEWWVRV